MSGELGVLKMFEARACKYERRGTVSQPILRSII